MMRNFRPRDAAFAAVWLIFLLPVLLQLLLQPSYSTVQRTWAVIITAVFCAAYLVSFGTVHDYPRGWSHNHRVAIRWWGCPQIVDT